MDCSREGGGRGGGGGYQEQDLGLSNQSQGCREFTACPTAVAFADDVPVVAQLQFLQEIVHHLGHKRSGWSDDYFDLTDDNVC